MRESRGYTRRHTHGSVTGRGFDAPASTFAGKTAVPLSPSGPRCLWIRAHESHKLRRGVGCAARTLEFCGALTFDGRNDLSKLLDRVYTV